MGQETAHKTAGTAFRTAGDPFFDPDSEVLQPVLNLQPLTQDGPQNQRTQDHQHVFRLQEHLHADSRGENPHTRKHGGFEPIAQVRSKQHADAAADQYCDDIYESSGHFPFAVPVDGQA